MKILVIGDIHCKPEILMNFYHQADKYDKIVFVGDACDNFGQGQEANIKAITTLSGIKDTLKDKFVWLIGNHDWGYYDDSVDMTGHIKKDSAKVYQLLKDNLDKWDILYEQDGYLFSHAGVCTEFLRHPLLCSSRSSEFVKTVNNLKNRPGPYNPLNGVGISCGGYQTPSPLWMRPSDCEYSQLNPIKTHKQIIGHTPVRDIHFERGMLLVDTFSQYQDLTPYGDRTVLLIENDKLYTLDSQGKNKKPLKEVSWHRW